VGDKLTNGAVTNKLPLTLHNRQNVYKSWGRKRERTSINPADEKAVYNNRDQRSDYDRDLANLVRDKNDKAVSAIQQPSWVEVL